MSCLIIKGRESYACTRITYMKIDMEECMPIKGYLGL